MPLLPKHLLKAEALPDRIEVGLDEVGRGALISRVMAGAVVFPSELAVDKDPDNLFCKIRDSKKVSAPMRERMYDFIKENAIACATGWADEKEIDMHNIRGATMLSFHRALDDLKPPGPIDFLLVDGTGWDEYTCPIRGTAIPHMCVMQGDNAFVPIAAAALLAKVERDRYIRHLCDIDGTLDERYGLMTNMGYGASKHCIGLQTWGCTPYHRMSFKICKNGGITAAAMATTEGTPRNATPRSKGRVPKTEPVNTGRLIVTKSTRVVSTAIPEWDSEDEDDDTMTGSILEEASHELDLEEVD